MRALTPEEIDVLRHICARGWIDSSVTVDRAKLAAQIEHLTAEAGCEVDGCPCLDFHFRGESTWNDEFSSDRATDEAQIVVVMDVKNSDWQANLFVCGGIISWLEFSSFGDEYPTRLPAACELV